MVQVKENILILLRLIEWCFIQSHASGMALAQTQSCLSKIPFLKSSKKVDHCKKKIIFWYKLILIQNRKTPTKLHTYKEFEKNK